MPVVVGQAGRRVRRRRGVAAGDVGPVHDVQNIDQSGAALKEHGIAIVESESPDCRSVAVQRHGASELVARGAAGGGQLDGFRSGGPAHGRPDEQVRRTGVFAGAVVATARPNQHGVAVEGDGNTEQVARGAVGGGQLGGLRSGGPVCGRLDEQVG